MNYQYQQPHFEHQLYGQPFIRSYTRATHNNLRDFNFPEFPEGAIVNYRPRNGQQDLCRKTCTPFLKQEIKKKYREPWITNNLYEVQGQDGKVRYEERDSKGKEIGRIYAEEHTPINSSSENKKNKEELETTIKNVYDEMNKKGIIFPDDDSRINEQMRSNGGNDVFNLKKFLKIFKAKKPIKAKKPTKPKTPIKAKKPTKPKTIKQKLKI